ncbi:MAG: 4Fe-4S binding protein [Deltaproteobacteria bacterium]|nr:4Fe-4S binding protein [Deltaproteobacteria bacterium]
MKTVFVNPERCIGCKQCQIACAVEHSVSKGLYGAISETPVPRPRILVAPGLYLDTSFPNKCRHCDPAPCMAVCPSGAIGRDGELDIVVVDGHKCIACAMCAMVCPFDVLTFYPSIGIEIDKPVALKCDHCIDRRRQGRIPACVEACKVGALVYGELNDMVKRARTQLAVKVSSAVGEIQAEQVGLPAHISAWRTLGESLSRAGKEVK